jgi:hypothetical protein
MSIKSPTDGAQVTRTNVTVAGTAKALRETIDTAPQPQPFPDPIEPGQLPDGPIGVPLPSSSDEQQDVTDLIQKVEVKVETGTGTGQFQPATATGPSDRPFAEWTFAGSLPPVFRQAVITARVTLGGVTESTSIRVFGRKAPVLVGK